MKRWIIGTAGFLGLSVVVVLGIYAYVAVGNSLGEQWSSLDGPGPVWRAIVGFGAVYAVVISAAVLVVLVLVAVLRAYLPRVTGKQ
ncbi:hypothetical protein GY21_11280 [Cryobacterium roopkundense]|uniref:Uncharacterized protein n=1 Tax=Cryobacterium roopkundense TaxID=1001240 RepID=A0A099J4R0_9MICO|nr:hypothetical protein [Cryobacterium roopkundense]KGJ73394.1 hypothetical protein GY21_11280 [Cryobacterium roopkundense]MBB5640492.1 hypothetical protein [Cryobacterium roopkundense]